MIRHTLSGVDVKGLISFSRVDTLNSLYTTSSQYLGVSFIDPTSNALNIFAGSINSNIFTLYSPYTSHSSQSAGIQCNASNVGYHAGYFAGLYHNYHAAPIYGATNLPSFSSINTIANLTSGYYSWTSGPYIGASCILYYNSYQGRLYRSTDGYNFTNLGSVITTAVTNAGFTGGSLIDIHWVNNQFVAVCMMSYGGSFYNKAFVTSSDGITWTYRSYIAATAAGIASYPVCWTGTYYIVVGAGAWRSSDLSSWTQTHDSSGAVYGVGYQYTDMAIAIGKTVLFTSSADLSGVPPRLYRTDDYGTTITQIDLPATHTGSYTPIIAIHYINNTILAIGCQYGYIAKSSFIPLT